MFFRNKKHQPVNHHWLVVWNMKFIFPYIGNFIIPTDELSIIFQRGRVKTTNQINIYQPSSTISIHQYPSFFSTPCSLFSPSHRHLSATRRVCRRSSWNVVERLIFPAPKVSYTIHSFPRELILIPRQAPRHHWLVLVGWEK